MIYSIILAISMLLSPEASTDTSDSNTQNRDTSPAGWIGEDEGGG